MPAWTQREYELELEPGEWYGVLAHFDESLSIRILSAWYEGEPVQSPGVLFKLGAELESTLNQCEGWDDLRAELDECAREQYVDAKLEDARERRFERG